MNKILKYVLVFVVGGALGVVAELLTPTKYAINITSGCLEDKANPNLVFMIRTDIYDRRTMETFPLYSESSNVTSNELTYDFISGRLNKLSQAECNKIILTGEKK